MNEITSKKIYEVFGITPGLWHFNSALDCIFSDKRTNLFDGDGRDDLFVCLLDVREYRNNQSNEIKENNAHLIATSPKMLVALVKIQMFADSVYNTEVSETYYKEIIESVDYKNRKWSEIKKELIGDKNEVS